MFGLFRRKKQKSEERIRNLIESGRNANLQSERADNAYINQVIMHSLHHAISQNTFVGALNGGSDFEMTALPDGVTFASNLGKHVSALQEKQSTALMFANVPLVDVALIAAPSAIEFNLRQEPKWEPAATNKDDQITEFRATISVDLGEFTGAFRFTAAESNVRLTPTSKDVPGTVMTMSVRVDRK